MVYEDEVRVKVFRGSFETLELLVNSFVSKNNVLVTNIISDSSSKISITWIVLYRNWVDVTGL